ncbi:MAG: 4a-hydroxytetrahydrobiopterin dehydratase [Rickettsiales bacterium]|nr:4a-hydroxytetrahydrobiopterin dehydratase [Rickettsiales bacterium]
MTLSEKKCEPCESSNVAPLDAAVVTNYLQELVGWEALEDNTKIHKAFKFKNFKTSLEFVNQIAVIAEEEKHHPDILFGWGYCDVYVQTHSINGLHRNDFILAAKIEEIHRKGT